MAELQAIMKPIALVCLLGVILGGSDAWSQGAMGGSLGNDSKSLSGSSPEPRAAPSARRERSEPRAAPPRRSSGDGGGSAARFDGTWQLAFVGQTAICAGKTTSSSLTISGGTVGQGGSISSGGALQAVGNNGGVSAVMTGRLSGRSGSGTMQMSNGCTLRWTARKQ
jgi:hypothetical protein